MCTNYSNSYLLPLLASIISPSALLSISITSSSHLYHQAHLSKLVVTNTLLLSNFRSVFGRHHLCQIEIIIDGQTGVGSRFILMSKASITRTYSTFWGCIPCIGVTVQDNIETSTSDWAAPC